MVIGDFNNDGKPDVVAVNSYGTAQNVYMLLGNGGGTLQPASLISVNGGLYAVAAGDFNGDGNLDLAMVDNTHGAVLILLGNGDGTFVQPTSTNTCSTGAQPVALAIGDLNGDRKLDIVTANYGANSVTVCLGDGAGGLSATNTVTASTLSGSNPNGVAIADVTGRQTRYRCFSLAKRVLRYGRQRHISVPEYTNHPCPASTPYAVAVADLNGDNKPDLTFPNGNGTSVFWEIGRAELAETGPSGAGFRLCDCIWLNGLRGGHR